jgi:hypothetical protein
MNWTDGTRASHEKAKTAQSPSQMLEALVHPEYDEDGNAASDVGRAKGPEPPSSLDALSATYCNNPSGLAVVTLDGFVNCYGAT